MSTVKHRMDEGGDNHNCLVQGISGIGIWHDGRQSVLLYAKEYIEVRNTTSILFKCDTNTEAKSVVGRVWLRIETSKAQNNFTKT